MKVTLNATNGEKTAKPFDVLLSVKSNLNVNDNKLIISFSQSKVDDVKSDNTIDYIGLKRQAIVIDKPTLPSSVAELKIYSETELKKHIEALKLPNVTSITL